MMYDYLIAVGAILLLMLAWITVQHVARLFARRHPELGSAREIGGCGSSCSSCGSRCETGDEQRN